MRGYDRDEYEDLDEYEEEGEEQEEEEVGEDEYEEEEARQPTQEELEYLELRQRLKEAVRKQMKKDSGSAPANSHDKKNKLPYDNYGSFFGPSQPVIAQRVIEESKSLLESPHLAARVSKANHSTNNKGVVSTPTGSKPRANDHPPKVNNMLKTKTKVQMLKNTRDYAFLLSDDAELPAPIKDAPPRNISVPHSESQSAQVPPKSKQSLSNNGRHILNGREQKKPVPTGSQMQPKVGPHKLTSASKPNRTSVDSGKQLGRTNMNGPGRPLGPKGLPSKVPTAAVEKKVTPPSAKSSMHGVHKPLPSKLQSSIPKQPFERKKEFQETSKGKLMSKQPVSSSKPQIKSPLAKNSARATLQEYRPKKRPVRQYSDDDEDDDGGRAIDCIRKMFGYNPHKYRDNDDDSDMEANFDDIMKEERLSAKIAKEEDEEELRKIEEEERRERLRKEAKKRKMRQ